MLYCSVKFRIQYKVFHLSIHPATSLLFTLSRRPQIIEMSTRKEMIQFKISAPGHLTLFGEYAMKCGKSGVTAGIDLRTTLTFAELELDIIQLEFPQIDLLLTISLQQFLMFYYHCDLRLLREQVLQFVTGFSHLASTENQKLILQVFFYLLVHITRTEKLDLKSFHIKLSTELMTDTDLVCLTPSAVCLAACFLLWSRRQTSDAHDVFNGRDLLDIQSYALKCEEISRQIQLPSVTVCTFGSVIQHTMNYIDNYNSVKWLACIPCETILLVDSKHTPPLEIQMQRLMNLVNINPVAVNWLFEGIDFATNIASDVLQRLNAIYENDGLSDEEKRLNNILQHHVLMTFVDMNQRLLQLLNLSHFHLNEICEMARRHGMYGKYTDIGNGRYAYIWCHPQMSQKRVTFLSQDLMANRYGVTMTSLSRYGVKID